VAQTGRAYARERPDPDPRPYAFLCDVTAQLLRLFAAHLDLLGRTGEADAAEELSVRVLSLGLAISEHGTSEEALGVMDGLLAEVIDWVRSTDRPLAAG